MNIRFTKQALLIILAFIAFNSNAVITRHDVEPERYKVASAPGYFIDMPFQGAAVLIDKQWLVAPAHVIYTFMYEYENKPINIHGVENRIAEVILHPDYERVGGSSEKNEKSSLLAQLGANIDIALIRLARPVNHVQPIAIYGGNSELGMEMTGFGRGAIGTGLTGEEKDSEGPSIFVYSWYKVTQFFSDWAFTQEDYQLQRYSNQITDASKQWLRYTFDKENKALPLEGTIGSGDSGGAAVVFLNNTPVLVGMASWREFDGNVEEYSFGHYGETAVLTRVSYFKDWITKHVKTAKVVL
jgi:hypothetical protein